MTALLGRNGVGKTTTLRAILGLVGRRGSVELDGRRADVAADAPHRAAAASATCPRTATSSPGSTVEENLRLAERDAEPRYDLVYDLFPELRAARASSGRARSPAGSSRWSRSRGRC